MYPSLCQGFPGGLRIKWVRGGFHAGFLYLKKKKCKFKDTLCLEQSDLFKIQCLLQGKQAFMILFHFPFQSFIIVRKEYSTASLSLEKIGILMSFVKESFSYKWKTQLHFNAIIPMWLREHKLASQDTSIAGFLIQFDLKIVHLSLRQRSRDTFSLQTLWSQSLSWTWLVALMLRQPKLTDGNRHWTVQCPPGIHPL